jgi:serine/threonine protein phosphatase PrpC
MNMNSIDKEQTDVLCFSQTGKSHMEDGLACEDVSFTAQTANFLFFGLADGQSGKRFCTVGGRAVLKAIAQYIADKTIRLLAKSVYPDEIQYELIRVIRGTLSGLSQAYQEDITAFSSTIVAVAVDTDSKDYLAIHLGDGAILGVKRETGAFMLSAPENGITHQYTWLTTSPNALRHLRIYRGSVKNLERLILLTDGATMLCRGGNIAKKAKPVLCDLSKPEAIANAIRKGKPLDDASCIVVDF